MKSMTGYAYKEYQDENIHIILELKSFNNRYLDINLRIPSYINRLEPKIREFILKNIKRGRIELYLKIVETREDLSFILDPGVVKNSINLLKELKDLAEENAVKDDLGLSHLLEMDGIFKSEKLFDIENFSLLFFPLLEDVFDSYERMRILEGRATEKDIKKKIEIIKNRMEIISDNVLHLEEKLKSDILERFKGLEESPIHEPRIYSEIAILLMKYGINEEVHRIKTHIAGFESEMSNKNSGGKKLDFICQELNREINTIGSKSIMIQINQAVIEIKNAIEDIREQLRNVE